MKMNDDYLWDQTGEPDAEIEQLEELLVRFRHQAKAPELPLQTRRFFWPRLAAAAAVIVMLVAGLWVVLNRQSGATPEIKQAAKEPSAETIDQKNQQATNKSVEQNNQPVPEEKMSQAPKPQRQAVADSRKEKRRREAAPGNRNDEAQNFSSTVAMVDFETANYLESAQMLLRSFRNIGSEDAEQSFDVSYEKERSRDLLYRNIVLRRDAEAKGNLPITDLLGTLEPILLDIANLPMDSSQAELRSIQERIQKKEIVATLQVYSAPVMSMALRPR